MIGEWKSDWVELGKLDLCCVCQQSPIFNVNNASLHFDAHHCLKLYLSVCFELCVSICMQLYGVHQNANIYV